MSRVGKNPVTVTQGVDVTLMSNEIRLKGAKGELVLPLLSVVKVTNQEDKIFVEPAVDTKFARCMWGTTRANISNMMKGVSDGFKKNLEISGVGYRASVQGENLVLQLGYSHDVIYPIPSGVSIVVPEPTKILVEGADKQKVGQIAAEIRSFRAPEPYKGKGIRYSDEVVLRKEGKKK